MDPIPAPAAGHPIRGVIFDLNATLLHAGNPVAWFTAALDLFEEDQRGGTRPTGTDGPAQPPMPSASDLAPCATRIWDHAREIDPGSERDLSPTRHREGPTSAATCATGRPAPMRWTMTNLPAGVRRALTWDTRDLRAPRVNA